MNVIHLRLPDELDRALREQISVGPDVLITDTMRRIFVASLLAAVLDGFGDPIIGDGLLRLNGGRLLRSERVQ